MKNISRLLVTVMAASLCVSCASMKSRVPREQWHQYLTRRDMDRCAKYAYNFTVEMPLLYQAGQSDSIREMIDYIREECGDNSRLFRTRMLMAMKDGAFADSLFDQSIITHLVTYRSGREGFDRYLAGQFMSDPWGMDGVSEKRFNDLLDGIATEQEGLAAPNSDARVLSTYYANRYDSAFALLQTPAMSGTKLRASYDASIAEMKRRYSWLGHWAIQVGSWQPQGENKTLGKHPEIAGVLGGENKHWRFDYFLAYRFSSSRNPYTTVGLTKLDTTRYFNSFSTGIDIGFKPVAIGPVQLDVFGGLAYDGVATVPMEDDLRKHLDAFAVSVGVRPRLVLNRRSGLYVALVYRYSFVDYPNAGGTPLNGNTATISIAVGQAFNETLRDFYKKLNYLGK